MIIDPKKAIHLVFGNSGKGNLDRYFKTNFPTEKMDIHCIYNDLSTGPLSDFTSNSDFEEYLSYWKQIDRFCNPDETENNFPPTDHATEFSIDFPKEKSLIIWHGNETNEKLMLYRYCNLLKGRDLYEINLNKWSTSLENKYHNNCLAMQNPEHLTGVFNNVKKIHNQDKSFYSEEWERLKQDNKLNRIVKSDRIISVDEDYYDQSILDNCTSKYQNAARIIGQTMGQQKTTIGDHYLLYRVHILITKKLIEWRGNLNAMRNFDIRKDS